MEHTRTDQVLPKVLRCCELDWPTSLPEGGVSLMAFFRKRNELTIEARCILWGSRVVNWLYLRVTDLLYYQSYTRVMWEHHG